MKSAPLLSVLMLELKGDTNLVSIIEDDFLVLLYLLSVNKSTRPSPETLDAPFDCPPVIWSAGANEL